MGRLELRIPLTEVIIVEEDLRRGLLRVVVEGEEYPDWHVGNEVMAIRVDHGDSFRRHFHQLLDHLVYPPPPIGSRLIRKEVKE